MPLFNYGAKSSLASEHLIPADADLNLLRNKSKKRAKRTDVIQKVIVGKPMEDYSIVDQKLEEVDDDDEEENCLTSTNVDQEDENVGLPEFKRRADLILNEFFQGGDFDEVSRTILELNSPFFSDEFIKRLIVRALSLSQHDNSTRERVSRLLVNLRFNVVSFNAISKGFQRVLDSLDEYVLDAPHCRSYLAKFIARAVKDEVLAPVFVIDERFADDEVMKEAKSILSVPHSSSTILNCWGLTNSMSVEDIKREIKVSVQEYFVGHDLEKSMSDFILDDSMKSFGHEVVYRLIVTALTEYINGNQEHDAVYLNLVCELIEALFQRGEISVYQLHTGINRANVSMSDVTLDSPFASDAFIAISDRLAQLA
jgi:MA3 domain